LCSRYQTIIAIMDKTNFPKITVTVQAEPWAEGHDVLVSHAGNGKPLCFYAMPLAKATFSATQKLLRK
ncbi:MAG: hypothetical protein IJ523_12440, partial [Succinivibrionaceae bacterium]|nr:hypothetical protein [Succinivibrionaceae bacterium]